MTLSLDQAVSAAWFSGNRSMKSTNFLSSIFLNWVSDNEGGVKGFRNEAQGSLGGVLEKEFIPGFC